MHGFYDSTDVRYIARVTREREDAAGPCSAIRCTARTFDISSGVRDNRGKRLDIADDRFGE